MSSRTIGAALLASALIGGWAAAQVPAEKAKGKPKAEAKKALRILFIGNSLTASNDLPDLFRALARAGGHEAPVVQSVVSGGFSLEDHWDHGNARRAIARGKWDYVVLQQGPSALEESRTQLIRDARRFAELIRRAGARPALYTVWPSTARARDLDRVCESYRLAAAEVDGLLLPAGDAWRRVLRAEPEFPLYSPDGLHPTLAGSYLAALVMYKAIYDATPVGLPTRLNLGPSQAVRLDLTRAQVERLQNAADAPAEPEPDGLARPCAQAGPPPPAEPSGLASTTQ